MAQRLDRAFTFANENYARRFHDILTWPQSHAIPDPPHGPLVVIVSTTIVFALPPSTSIAKALRSGMLIEYYFRRFLSLLKVAPYVFLLRHRQTASLSAVVVVLVAGVGSLILDYSRACAERTTN